MDSPRLVANHLFRVTGVECFYLTVDSTDARTASRVTCSICEGLLSGHAPPASADAYHRFSIYQAEQLGTSYIYVCGHAMLHIAAPVLTEEMRSGALICGPAVLGAVEADVAKALRTSPTASLLSKDAVDAWVAALPVLSPGEATALADIVARVARSVSVSDDAFDVDQNNDLSVSKYLDFLRSMEGDKRSGMPYPIESEIELRANVAAGNKPAAQRVLSEISSRVFAEDASLDEVRSRVLELVVLLSRAAIEGGANAEEVFGVEYRLLPRLRSLTSVIAVRRWLERIVDRFMDLVFDLRHLRYSAHIAAALGVIRDRYSEPVSLSDAAEVAGVTPGHLGRVFKSELKVSFSRYLQNTRIHEAKRLLRTSTLAVGDIGSAVGFDDHSYFTQVFRREAGVSPSEYRDRKRRTINRGT